MTNSPRNRRASDGHLVANAGPDLDIVRTALHGIRRDIELFNGPINMAEAWSILDRIKLRARDALKQLDGEAA